jgi:hypothetical protein
MLDLEGNHVGWRYKIILTLYFELFSWCYQLYVVQVLTSWMSSRARSLVLLDLESQTSVIVASRLCNMSVVTLWVSRFISNFFSWWIMQDVNIRFICTLYCTVSTKMTSCWLFAVRITLWIKVLLTFHVTAAEVFLAVLTISFCYDDSSENCRKKKGQSYQ